MENKQKNKAYLALGVICLAFFAVWQWSIGPTMSAIPGDFRYEAELISFDNFYDEPQKKYLGEKSSVTSFAYEAKPSDQDDDILEVKNTFDVSTPAGEEIIHLERVYGIDKNTGKHQFGYGNHNRQGYLFAPRNLNYGEGFIYWHINYDGPAKMNFVKETKLFGLKVYEYEAGYESVSIDQTDNLRHLPGVGLTRGVEVEPRLRLWVEPKTGYLVKYEDDSVAYFYDLETRERIAPWNKFRNEYTEASIAEHVATAAHEKQSDLFIRTLVPTAALAFAIAFFSLFLFKKKTIELGHAHRNLPRNQKILFFLFFMIFSACVFVFARHFFLNANNEYAKVAFESRISEINQNILEQFNTRTNVLRGARGLFDASLEVTSEEWKKYVDSLDISNNFIGITSLRFAAYVRDLDKQAHEAEMKKVVGNDYKIWPESKRDVYAPVIFYEPRTATGDRIFGFDHLSDKERGEATIKARDTGEIVLSEKVTQIFANDLPTSAGILIYLPVYKKSLPHDTVAEKELAAKGFIYSAFRMKDFMESIQGIRNGIINIEVFDTNDETSLAEDRLLYTNNPDYKHGVTYDSKFARLAKLEVGGRTWIIRYSATPEFGLDFSQRFFPPMLIVFGSIIYIAITVFLLQLFILKTRAMVIIKEDEARIETLENRL